MRRKDNLLSITDPNSLTDSILLKASPVSPQSILPEIVRLCFPMPEADNLAIKMRDLV